MALIKCVECGKEMSTQAAACPHCGMKMPKRSVWPTVILSILAVPAAIIVATLLFGESNDTRQARYQAARAECIKIASGAAVRLPGGFDRTSEAFAYRAAKECLAARGFDVADK